MPFPLLHFSTCTADHQRRALRAAFVFSRRGRVLLGGVYVELPVAGPFRTAVPSGGKSTQNSISLFPERDCSSGKVEQSHELLQ